MADISVSLGLDDGDYQSKIKKADSAAKQFGNSFDQSAKKAQGGLNSLGTSIDKVHSKSQSFIGLIAGAGIATFAKSLIDSANNLIDMAASLDVNVARFQEMGVAASVAGGSLDDVHKMIARMESSIGDAADGNIKLRNSFAELGVSVKDMQTKSPDQIFNQIAVALSNIDDPSKRARLGIDTLGKSVNKMDWGGYVNGILQTYGTMEKFAESQKKASVISERLGVTVDLVRASFLQLLEPILNILSPTNDLKSSMEQAEVAAKVLAGGLALFIGSAAVKSVMTLVEGFRGLAAVLGVVTPVTAGAAAATTAYTASASAAIVENTILASTLGRIATAQNAVNVATLSLASLQASGTASTTALAAAQNTLAAAEARLATVTEAAALTRAQLTATTGAAAASTVALGTASTGAAGGVTALATASTGLMARLAPLAAAATAAAAAIGLLYSADTNSGEDEAIKKSKELGDVLKTLTKEQLANYISLSAAEQEKIRDQLIAQQQAKKTAEIMAKVTGETGKQKGDTAALATNWKNIATQSTSQVAAIQEQTNEYNRQLEVTKDKIKLDTMLLSVSGAERTATLAFYSERERADRRRYDLEQKILQTKAQIQQNPQEAKEKGTYAVLAAYEQQLATVKDIAYEVYNLKQVEGERINALEMSDYFYNENQKAASIIRDIEQETAGITLTSDQQRLASIRRMIDEEVRYAQERRKSQLAPGQDLDPTEAADIEEKIRNAYKGVEEGTAKSLESARTFEAGWSKAYNQYVEDATNSAKMAEEMFTAVTGTMETAIDQFVRTGKINFKDLINSLIADLVKSNLKSLVNDIFNPKTGFFSSGGSGTGMLDSIGGWFSSLTEGLPGFASGGLIPSNSPVMVGERGPEILSGAAGRTVTPNNQINSGNSNITVVVQGSNNAPDVRRAAGQGMREALNMMTGARRYG